MSSWGIRQKHEPTDVAEAPEDPAAIARRAWATAIKLLGPRDHSAFELGSKLAKRGFDENVIVETIASLEHSNYVDDAAYAERYAEQRVRQSYGPLAIRAKLAERGVDSTAVDQAIRSLTVDWVEVAKEALAGKFTAAQLADRDEKVRMKVARFLQGRGFAGGDAAKAARDVVRDEE